MTHAACITEVDFVGYFPQALGIIDLRRLNNHIRLLIYVHTDINGGHMVHGCSISVNNIFIHCDTHLQIFVFNGTTCE